MSTEKRPGMWEARHAAEPGHPSGTDCGHPARIALAARRR